MPEPTPPVEDRHLLVVDDDPRLLSLLQRFLVRSGYHVTTAATASEAMASLRGLAFDLIVLDVMLPDMSGVALTTALRRTNDVPILLLTARGEAEDRIGGLEAGADDYLVKPFETRELLLRIATILRRVRRPATPTESSAVRFGDFVFDRGRRELMRGDEVIRLTPAELNLLDVMAATPGEAVSRGDLAEQSRITGSDRAVDVQITRLRRKIESDPRQPRFVLTMRGEGYALRPGG